MTCRGLCQSEEINSKFRFGMFTVVKGESLHTPVVFEWIKREKAAYLQKKLESQEVKKEIRVRIKTPIQIILSFCRHSWWILCTGQGNIGSVTLGGEQEYTVGRRAAWTMWKTKWWMQRMFTIRMGNTNCFVLVLLKSQCEMFYFMPEGYVWGVYKRL